jgi:hypothetical protein
MNSASQALAAHHNVSAARRISPTDVLAAFAGRDEDLLDALLWEASPETILDLRSEAGLSWNDLEAIIARHLPADHPVAAALHA